MQACVVVFTTLPTLSTVVRTPAISGLVSGSSAVKAEPVVLNVDVFLVDSHVHIFGP